jgi:hypothetical protein
MKQFLERPEFDWVELSQTRKVGFWALDFVACRHFRMPVPASAWYRLGIKRPEIESDAPGSGLNDTVELQSRSSHSHGD